MKFKVRSNPKKEWALAVEKEVTGFLQLAGWEAAENCEDMTIIIGGDGTIFHNKNGIEGAVFAIGGPQSKICQANEKNWKTRLGKVLAKPETETRVALSGKINGKDAGWAINDFVVHSRRHNYVEMNVSAAGRTVEFGGDGVIVASPTGSTGYAYSAGGRKLAYGARLLDVVPICPYLRRAKPFVVPATEKVSVVCRGEADLITDGQEIIELRESSVIEITGNREIKFIRMVK